MFERLDSGQKLGVLRKQSRLALCCCTMLAFTCNILLFQKQVSVLSTKCSLALQDWKPYLAERNVRILDQSPVSCWYSPFSQACRELESLKQNLLCQLLVWQFLVSCGRWLQSCPCRPQKAERLFPQGGFVSWINTFDKVQLEGFHSLTTPSLLQHL